MQLIINQYLLIIRKEIKLTNLMRTKFVHHKMFRKCSVLSLFFSLILLKYGEEKQKMTLHFRKFCESPKISTRFTKMKIIMF